MHTAHCTIFCHDPGLLTLALRSNYVRSHFRILSKISVQLSARTIFNNKFSVAVIFRVWNLGVILKESLPVPAYALSTVLQRRDDHFQFQPFSSNSLQNFSHFIKGSSRNRAILNFYNHGPSNM